MIAQETRSQQMPVVEVGRSFREWWFVALVGASICLLAVGVLLLAVHERSAPAVLILSGVAGFSAVMSALVISRTRFRVEIRPEGFAVRNRAGEREFADDQVICASLSLVPNFTNGILKSTTRTFDVWVETEPEPERIKVLNRLAVGAADPLAPLIERITEHLYARANAALEAGQPFEGEGWTLHPKELVVHLRHTPEAVRFDSLAAADVFDNQLCVWKDGQDEPVLRIPVTSANTPVLLRLLRERIASRRGAGEPPAGGGLGRILFERKPGRPVVALLWLLPVLALGAFAAAIVGALVRGRFELVLVGIAALGGLGMFWALILLQCAEFRVHEHGVQRKLLFHTQQLKYADVDSFTYAAVRQYVKGVYSGTNFTLTFASWSGGKLKKLTYSKNLRNADSALERLRDAISQLIAERMQAQFVAGQTVVWTDGLRFLAEGLEYRAAGFFGRKAPTVIPYSQIAGFELDQGWFWLWVAGKKSAAVKENGALPNFFPGYLLLSRLLAARAAERAG